MHTRQNQAKPHTYQVRPSGHAPDALFPIAPVGFSAGARKDPVCASLDFNVFFWVPKISKMWIFLVYHLSQIVQKRQKSGLRSEHSGVFTSRHVVWTDSIPIEPNQRKKYKLASLLSGREPPVLCTAPSYLSSWKNQVTVYPLPYHLH